MTVEQVCDRNVVCVDFGAPVVYAAQLIHERNVAELVVTEQLDGKKRPVGLLSERDIVIMAVAADPENLKELRVGQLLSRKLPVVCSSDFVRDVVKRMSQMMLRRVPVVDEGGQPFGIVRVENLLNLVVDQQRTMSRNRKSTDGPAEW